MISIIMPVYNGEKYLDRAIASIKAQTYSDWELIAVDDGSKDSSPQMLDEYAVKDCRIRVIHKQNGGVSNARQDGVDAARGEYLIQFDCDDWAEPDYLESLYEKARETNADMVWCNMVGEQSDGAFQWKMDAPEDSKEQIRMLLDGKLWGGTVYRLFKAEICHNPNVSFPRGCIAWEDMAFLISAFLQCKIVAYCDKELYHYDLTNTSSITHSANVRLLPDGYMKALAHIDNSLERAGMTEEFAYGVRKQKLIAVRDYIDCYSIQDFDKFVKTYPDAIAHIGDYPNYPLRLKQCVWLIQHNCKLAVPMLLRFYALLRKLGLSTLSETF